MCAIVGLVGKFSEKEANKALTAMAHRGPDDRGLMQKNDVILGHLRLSIVDLSHLGHQPMVSEDGRYTLVFNGEIYNHRELRDELASKGVSFKSHSDTEVLLHLFEREGQQCLPKLNGMFAFAIYDDHEKKVFLARDPYGIKTVYYFNKDNQFGFCSEVKGLLAADPDLGNEQNPLWQILFLAFGYIPQPHTTARHIMALPKGHVAIFDLKSRTLSLNKWYEMPVAERPLDLSQVRETFENVVRRHMMADVPVGVFLSGGIDSSLLAILARQTTNDLHTVSADFIEKKFSEFEFQKKVSDLISSRHSNLLISKEKFLSAYPQALNSMDQPSVDGLNTYSVSEVANANGLKVVLSGLGSDEIFYGYSYYKKFPFLKYIWPIRGLFKLAGLLPLKRFKKLEYLSSDTNIGRYLAMRGLFAPSDIAKILNLPKSQVWQAIKSVEVTLPKGVAPYSRKALSYMDLEYYLAGQLLKDCDYMSMAHSLEVRVPFLDKEIVELAFATNDRQKFDRKIPKSMIVNAFTHALPREIVFRPKKGFTFPFAVWLPTVTSLSKYNDWNWPRNWALYLKDYFSSTSCNR